MKTLLNWPEKENRSLVLFVLSSLVWILLWKFYGSHHFYTHQLAQHWVIHPNLSLSSALYLFGTTFFAFFLAPLFLSVFVFKKSPASLGLKFPAPTLSFRWILLLTLVFAASAFPASRQEPFLMEYPYWKQAGSDPSTFFAYALAYGIFFYLPWEFFFRGFMQFSLRERIGPTLAILFQTSFSVLLHIGKPDGETLSSILGALVWGILAERTGSIFYPILIHWTLGVALDYFILFVG